MKVRASVVSKLLFWVPLAAAVPACDIINRSVPDKLGGGIGAGLEKLNVELGVVMPVIGVCWAAAFLIEWWTAIRRRSMWPVTLVLGLLMLAAVLSVA
jgi:hypothetical protein